MEERRVKMLEEPTFESPVRVTGAGGAFAIGRIKTVGEAIDYVDTLLDKEVGHPELLEAAKRDLHAANDSRKSADIAAARDSLVKALGALKILVENSVTGLS